MYTRKIEKLKLSEKNVEMKKKKKNAEPVLIDCLIDDYRFSEFEKEKKKKKHNNKTAPNLRKNGKK